MISGAFIVNDVQYGEGEICTMSHEQSSKYPILPLNASASVRDALLLHWSVYVMEAVELACFMLAACMFGTLLFYTGSPLRHIFPSHMIRLVLMGVAMGVTAVAIIRSSFGMRSGAHFNPVISFTFFCLGRMHRLDMVFYIAAQFAGGSLGVLVAHLLLGSCLASPSVRYVVTVPGRYGIVGAFVAELFMGLFTIGVVLLANGHKLLARYTWLLVGLLVTIYVIVFSPISGFSLNPARTVSSAMFAGVWTDIWLYLSAPLLGMLLGAGLYVLLAGSEAVYCAKVYHDLHSPCPFRCRFRQLALSETAAHHP